MLRPGGLFILREHDASEDSLLMHGLCSVSLRKDCAVVQIEAQSGCCMLARARAALLPAKKKLPTVRYDRCTKIVMMTACTRFEHRGPINLKHGMSVGAWRCLSIYTYTRRPRGSGNALIHV